MLLRVRHGTIAEEGTVPKLTTNRRSTSQQRTAKAAKSKAAKKGAKSKAVEPTPEEEAAFTEALIQSGQAARLDSEGKLPAGATHKIVVDETGKTTVVRRRFSIT